MPGFANHGRVCNLLSHPSPSVLLQYVLSCGQDKMLNVWSTGNGKSMRSYKAGSNSTEPLKIALDPSGTFFATSCSDKVAPPVIVLTWLHFLSVGGKRFLRVISVCQKETIC